MNCGAANTLTAAPTPSTLASTGERWDTQDTNHVCRWEEAAACELGVTPTPMAHPGQSQRVGVVKAFPSVDAGPVRGFEDSQGNTHPADNRVTAALGSLPPTSPQPRVTCAGFSKVLVSPRCGFLLT